MKIPNFVDQFLRFLSFESLDLMLSEKLRRFEELISAISNLLMKELKELEGLQLKKIDVIIAGFKELKKESKTMKDEILQKVEELKAALSSDIEQEAKDVADKIDALTKTIEDLKSEVEKGLGTKEVLEALEGLKLEAQKVKSILPDSDTEF